MAKKNRAVNKIKFSMAGKTSVIEVPMFTPSGHQIYSGFGVHQKTRKADRRARKLEEKRAKFYREDY
jgi:capsule polysaccharide export protein KpsC/LpsZ